MLCEFSCLCHSLHHMHCYGCSRSSGLSLNRNRRKRPKVDARSLGTESYSSLRRVEKKENKIACPLLDVFACGQVSSPRLYRLTKISEKKIFLAFLNSKLARFGVNGGYSSSPAFFVLVSFENSSLRSKRS